MRAIPPLNIYIPDTIPQEDLQKFITDHQTQSNMRIIPNTGSRSDLEGHSRVLVFSEYNHRNVGIGMLATRAGILFEGIVDFAEYHRASRE